MTVANLVVRNCVGIKASGEVKRENLCVLRRWAPRECISTLGRTCCKSCTSSTRSLVENGCFFACATHCCSSSRSTCRGDRSCRGRRKSSRSQELLHECDLEQDHRVGQIPCLLADRVLAFCWVSAVTFVRSFSCCPLRPWFSPSGEESSKATDRWFAALRAPLFDDDVAMINREREKYSLVWVLLYRRSIWLAIREGGSAVHQQEQISQVAG